MDKMTDIRACSPAHEIEVQAALLRTPEFMAAFDAAKFAAQLDRIAARLRESAEAQAQGGGEVPEAELIALVAGPFKYHHKMDEAAEREGKAFDRCRELTIQNIRTWCATRRAMLAAAPPSAPVGVEGLGLRDALMGAKDKLAGVEWDALCRMFREQDDIIRTQRNRLAQQPAAEFRNDGNSEADFIAHHADACTACGGSGHKADQQPAAVDGALQRLLDRATALAEVLPTSRAYAHAEQVQQFRVALNSYLAAQPGGSDNDR